jgi:hypothetical protein
MSSIDILKRLKNNNLRPASLKELLAYGCQFPEMQLKFPIVAMGSLCPARKREGEMKGMPCLYGDYAEGSGQRYLEVFFLKASWEDLDWWRFLVFPR